MKVFFKQMLNFVKKYKNFYLPGLCSLIITSGLQLAIPQLIKDAVNSISTGSFLLNDILNKVVFILIFALAIAFGRFLWRYFIHGASRRIERDIRTKLFQRMLSLSPAFYRDQQTGDLMARCTNDVNAIRMATGMAFVAFTDGLFMTVAILIIMFSQNPQVAAIIIIPLPLITFFIISFGRMLGPKFKAVQEGYANISTHAQESFSGIATIKTYSLENHRLNLFNDLNDNYQNKTMDLVKLWGLFFPAVHFFAGISSFLLLYFGGTQVMNLRLSPGDFVAFMTYLEMMIWPLLGTGFTVNLLQRGAAAYKRVNTIIEADDEIIDTGTSWPLKDQQQISVNNLNIKVNETVILDNMSLTIPDSSIIGITGPTGSGKTTLINCIMRFLEVPDNTVLLNNLDIKQYALKNYRELFGYVPQNSFLFSDTIKRNVLFGNNSHADVAKLLTDVYFSRDLLSFPDGIDTQIGEYGVTLSGGQKQRLALARALAVHSPVLIMDDPFSAVDAETEEMILNNIYNIRKGKTTIIVSHRISTFKEADKIIVIENGTVSGEGSHAELFRNNSYYQKICTVQRSQPQT